jgi:hypothetical protein
MDITKQAQAGAAISNFWRNLPEGQRRMLIGGLTGAGVGGTLLALPALLGRREDEERPRSALGPALLGALLGGTAGAGLTGFQALRKAKPKPPPPTLSEKALGRVGEILAPNIGLTAGTAAGLLTRKTLSPALGPQRLTSLVSQIDPKTLAADKIKAIIKGLERRNVADLIRTGGRGVGLRARTALRGARAGWRGSRLLPRARGLPGLLALPGMMGAGWALDRTLLKDFRNRMQAIVAARQLERLAAQARQGG